MEPNKLEYSSALQDFNDARRKAELQDILARLTGRHSELLSYEEVAEKLKLNVRTDSGVHDIPLKAIIGSVGRYTEFTRDFLPRRNVDRQRWARVKAAVDDPVGSGLQPIDVYKVGEAYFVSDGNHRVSVAREEGSEFIEAHIIEVKIDIPITPDIQVDDLIIKAEYVDFLEKTEFAHLRPGVDLSVTVPGQYRILLEHIQIHRYFMGIDFQRDIPYPEAVGHWYDVVFTSIIEPIRERGLLRWFPGRTETDMYLWVSSYRADLEKELGWTIRPEVAAEKLAAEENPAHDLSETGSWRTGKMFDRYNDRLFSEILVPITGVDESWQALEQSILVGQKERSTLHGLHITSPKLNADAPEPQEIRARFIQRCQEVGLPGNMVVENGNISRQVCERALLTDLIVLNVSHPPSAGISGIRSGLRAIIANAARPILAIAGKTSPMDKALLAFDGSNKSKEALFVATYLVENWGTKLLVLTIADDGSQSVQDYAKSYLEIHEIQADFVSRKGSYNLFLETIAESQINLVVLGSYGGPALKEVMAGSAVDFLLRNSDCSLLICK